MSYPMRSRRMKYKYEHVRGEDNGSSEDENIPLGEDEVPLEGFNIPSIEVEPESQRQRKSQNRLTMPKMLCAFILALVLVRLVIGTPLLSKPQSNSPPQLSWSPGCEAGADGYQCSPDISHYWGQYSPFYSVPTEIKADLPHGCRLTFAQILSRHGSRDPTLSKTIKYGALIAKLKQDVHLFTGPYAFLNNYTYTLGADQLTQFGQREMVDSGRKFYNRYASLAGSSSLFVRASGETRVIESAENFTRGYHQAHAGPSPPNGLTSPIVVISEKSGSNNTLNHGLCDAFEDGPDSLTGKDSQKQWKDIFAKPIAARLNSDLHGANLTTGDVIDIMDLCPLNTVASSVGKISGFCHLFSDREWREYDYYQSLGKYYGYGNGNALGPTQGVGFANELIARLTGEPVVDHTSVNHTLDDSDRTFPIGDGQVLYADFSHDNDMTAIFSALGLYNSTPALSNTTLERSGQTKGYAASWTVPFAARAYFEKMSCGSSGKDSISGEEMVRVIVNDRVLPLDTCGADALGRCTLTSFINSLSFAQEGGKWDQCFVDY